MLLNGSLHHRLGSPCGQLLFLLVAGIPLALAGCGQGATAPGQNTAPPGIQSVQPLAANPASGAELKRGAPVLYTYEIVNVWPHDRGAFTEGLVFLDGQLFESTGLNGQSTLRRVDLKTGQVAQQVEVSPEYFGEGLAVLAGKAYQLTWRNHQGFVYDLKTFRQERDFAYQGEGWGLTTDGHQLIMSDGTARIRFLDPATFAVTRTLSVSDRNWPVDRLNELEYVKGEIYANIWGADYVVRIDPATGTVTGVIDFTGLLPRQDRSFDTDVLNGIAYDPKADRLFVTGKRWPKLFEVRLKPK